MSRSTVSTFQLFERFPDQESARIEPATDDIHAGRITPAKGGFRITQTIDPLTGKPRQDGE